MAMPPRAGLRRSAGAYPFSETGHKNPVPCAMTHLLLFMLGLVQIGLTLRLLHRIGGPDLSKEGRKLREATDQIREGSEQISEAVNQLEGQ